MRIDELEATTKTTATWEMVATELSEAVRRLEAENGNLREGLRKLEWVGTGIYKDHNGHCPVCGQFHQHCGRNDCPADWVGHKPDCWLAALLKETE